MQTVEEKIKQFKLIDYCQYLISSQTNYTITNLAEYLQTWNHDVINKYLRNEIIKKIFYFPVKTDGLVNEPYNCHIQP